MIIVTSGHVDHGKTALLKALTGTSTAHLPEEKKTRNDHCFGVCLSAVRKQSAWLY